MAGSVHSCDATSLGCQSSQRDDDALQQLSLSPRTQRSGDPGPTHSQSGHWEWKYCAGRTDPFGKL